jgi:hypothetical protein
VRASTPEPVVLHAPIPSQPANRSRARGARAVVYVNGRFLTQRVTGVQRYAREILSELDALLGDDADAARAIWRLVAPRGIAFPALTHVRCTHRGRLSGHAWEQLELPWIARDGFLAASRRSKRRREARAARRARQRIRGSTNLPYGRNVPPR